MWMRSVLSLVWMLLAGVALIFWNCSQAIASEPLRVCPALTRLGIPEPLWMAWALLGVSAVGLVAVWIPYLRFQRRQRNAQPERALLANIGRLPDPYVDYAMDAEGPDRVLELRKAIEVVEIAFATDSTATRAMTAEWMRLLVETNRAHNEGALDTEEFKVLNTTLLDAVTTLGSDRTMV